MKTQISFILLLLCFFISFNANGQNKRTKAKAKSNTQIKAPSQKGTIYNDSLPWLKAPNSTSTLQKSTQQSQIKKSPTKKGTIYTDSLPWVKAPNASKGQLRRSSTSSKNRIGKQAPKQKLANQGKNHRMRSKKNPARRRKN